MLLLSRLASDSGQILPYLHSRSHETRSAASTALSQIFTLVPLWTPYPDADSKPYGASTSLPPPEFPSFSVRELMEKGTLLLASSGKEFTKPTGILANSSEVKKARKEAMGRLGLDFLDSVADDMDLDKDDVTFKTPDVFPLVRLPCRLLWVSSVRLTCVVVQICGEPGNAP